MGKYIISILPMVMRVTSRHTQKIVTKDFLGGIGMGLKRRDGTCHLFFMINLSVVSGFSMCT